MSETQMQQAAGGLQLQANPADGAVQARAARQQYQAELQALRATWASLSQAEKLTALREIISLLARALRVEDAPG